MITDMTQKQENIVVTGEWDGEPIWRRKTAAELLADAMNELEENAKKRHQYVDPDEGYCGKSSNHNNGSYEACVECGVIRLGI